MSWSDIVCLAVDDSLPDFQSVFSVSEASQEWDGILSTCLYECCYKFNIQDKAWLAPQAPPQTLIPCTSSAVKDVCVLV